MICKVLDILWAMSSFRLQDIPMARDRTEGFCFVNAAGDVFQAADGTWMLTSAEAVHFALRHPEIFSSAEATQAGSGIPMPFVPVAIDPRRTSSTAGYSTPCSLPGW
jgi:hypothetical protein